MIQGFIGVRVKVQGSELKESRNVEENSEQEDLDYDKISGFL